MFFVFFRTYDALIGIVTHDFFNELSDTQIRFGMSLDERDKMFQTFVRNQYSAHLQEILLTMQNEYTDWQVSVQKPTSIREQVYTYFNVKFDRFKLRLLQPISLMILTYSKTENPGFGYPIRH